MRTLLTALVLLSLLAATGCEIAKSMQLENAVRDALKNDPRTAEFDLDIAATEEGVVTITGEVNQPGDGDVIREIASAVEGVTSAVVRTAAPEDSSGLMQDTVVPGIGGMGL